MTHVDSEENAANAVVVGGGFIGLEMVENLVLRGFEVTLVEMADQVLPSVAITADGVALEDGATFSQPLTLEIVVTDNVGNVPTPEIRLNGAGQAVTGTTAAIPIDLDGGYLVSVIADDAAGNQSRVERSFILDQGTCSLGDFDPSSGSSVADTAFTLRGGAGSATNVVVRVPIAGTDPVEYQDFLTELFCSFKAIRHGVNKGVNTRANVLQIDNEDVDGIEHFFIGDACFTVKTKNRNF